jgi:putative ABC transport system permease protein
MRKSTLVRRQISADRAPALLLAAVLVTGAFLGAAMPRWVDARLDQTLDRLVETAGRQSEFALRTHVDGGANDARTAIAAVRHGEPEVAAVYDQGRWSAAVGQGDVESTNGVPTPSGQPLVVDVRMPDDLTDKVSLVDGRLPAEPDYPPPLEFGAPEIPGDGPVVEVVAVAEVADALGLQVGDQLIVRRQDTTSTITGLGTRWPRNYLGVRLTGLVEPADPADLFWSDSPEGLVPAFDRGADSTTVRGTLLADPEIMAPFVASTQTMVAAEWHMDVVPGALDANRVEPVTTAIRRIEQDTSWRTSFDDLLAEYGASRAGAEQVSALGVASPAGLLVAVLLMAIRLVAERRTDAMALTRARGGRDRLLGSLLGAEAVIVAVPSVVVAAASAAWLLPASAGLLPYALPAVLLLVTVAGLPLTGVALAHRGTNDRPEREALRPSPRRLVLEAGVVVVALAGLWLLAGREGVAPGGVDPVVSFTPVLVATAAGLLTFRLVPFVVAATVRWVSPRRGATAFLAATRAARSPNHAVLPVIAVLVAVGIAAFGSTVQSTVDRAQEMSSWDAIKADAAVETSTLRVRAEDLPDLLPAATAVAAGYAVPAQRATDADGRQVGVDLLVVDVPAWERVTNGAPAPVEPVTTLATATPAGGAVPGVLEGGGADGLDVGDRFTVNVRGADLTVEVMDRVSDFPGAAGGSAVILPAAAVADGFGLQWPTVVYVAGEVPTGELADALDVRADQVTLRSEALELADTDPVLDATVDVFRFALLVAALLAAAAAVLGLLLTARSRSYTLSILRTLGLTSRQAGTLVAVEVVPTSVAAAAVGVGVGLGIGVIVSQALDLSGLTGLFISGDDVVLDVVTTVVAAAAVLAVVLAAVAVAVIVNRRARLGSVLRAGDPR